MPNEVIIKFKPVLPKSKHSSIMTKHSGKKLKKGYKREDSFLIEIKDKDIFDAIEEMKSDPDIESVSLNYIVRSTEYSNNDPYYQWSLDKTRTKKAWEIEKGDSNVIVAIVDSGIDRFHEDIYVKWWGWDFVNWDDDPMDIDGHGTHVAGTVRATIDNNKGIAGVAPNVSLLAIKVLENGSGTTFDVCDGIIYASDYADIINLSLGGSGGASLKEAVVNYAFGEGDLVIAAAGNDNTSDKHYPAACDNAIAVASTTSTDQRSSFSNFGSWIEIAAPGSSIVSTVGINLYGDYEYWNGTSMATPHVSALAALIWSVNRSLSNQQVENIIMGTAYDLGTPGHDIYFGWGRIDAFEALKAALGDAQDPDIPTVLSTTHPSQGTWYSSNDPFFSFNSTDDKGIIGYSYILDQNPTTNPDEIIETRSNTKSYTNLSDGIWYFHVKAEDIVEKWSGVADYKIQIDSTPPPAPSPDDGISGWTDQTSITFSWPAVTDTAPVTGYEWWLDTGTHNSTTETQVRIDGISEGAHTFYVKAINATSLAGPTGSHTVGIDLNDPGAPINLAVSPDNWTNVNSFAIDWTDPSDASGIAGSYYKLDTPPTFNEDGTWSTSHPVAGISVAGDGIHTIYVWLKDNAGNVNYLNYAQTDLYLDTDPPSTPALTSTTHPDELSWYSDNDPTFDFSSTDDNGVAGYSYVIDQISGTIPDAVSEGALESASYSDITDGTWWFHVRAIDIAGNAGATEQYKVQVDSTPPSTPSPDDGIGGPTSQTSITFSWPSVSDTAPITEYKWGFDDPATPNSTTDTQVEINGISEGNHTFHVKAVNEASLTGGAGSHTITIDLTAPAPPANISVDPSSWTNINSFTVNWDNPADTSGIEGCYYKLDSIPTAADDGTWSTSHPLTDITLPGDGIHTIYVWLKDNAGNVDHLNSAATELYLDTTPPGGPTSIGVTATALEAELKINWTPPSVADFSHVRIYRSETSGDIGTLVHDNVPGNEKYDQSLTTGIIYYYTIKAVDSVGNESTNTDQASGTPTDLTPPAEFNLISPANGSAGPNSLPTFSWQASSDPSGIAKYELWINGTLNVPNIDPGTTSITPASPLPPSPTPYSWHVIAYDTYGNLRESTVWNHTVAELTGPEISMTLDGREVSSGDIISSTPLIEAIITDDNGIDPTSIIIFIDEGTAFERRYESLSGSYIAGTLSFELPSPLTAGSHTIKLMADDVFGNTSETALSELNVYSKGKVIGIPGNAPNPANSSTGTYLRYTLSKDLDVRIKLYTIYGNLIWQTRCGSGLKNGDMGLGGAMGLNEVYWDARSSMGKVVPNGAYIYLVLADGEVIAKGTLSKID
jgi:thermitase